MRPGDRVQRNAAGVAYARHIMGLEEGEQTPLWVTLYGVVVDPQGRPLAPGRVLVRWSHDDIVYATRQDYLEVVP